MNEPAVELAALVRRQHGVLTRPQALGLGLTDRMIERRVGSGRWVRLDGGIYADVSHPFSWLRQVKAAELSLERAAVSHWAAAVLLGVPGVAPGHIDLTVPAGGSNRSRFAAVHRRPLTGTTVRDGIRVTSLPRTVCDLSRELTPTATRDLVHDLLVRRLVTLDALGEEIDRLGRLQIRGIGRMRAVVEACRDGRVPPTNELERALAAALDHPALPAHESQAAFPWWPERPERVDELIPAWRHIVEADGRTWHTREADFERDRWRDHQAQRHGYGVTRFTFRQLVDDPSYAVDVLLDIGATRVA